MVIELASADPQGGSKPQGPAAFGNDAVLWHQRDGRAVGYGAAACQAFGKGRVEQAGDCACNRLGLRGCDGGDRDGGHRCRGCPFRGLFSHNRGALHRWLSDRRDLGFRYGLSGRGDGSQLNRRAYRGRAGWRTRWRTGINDNRIFRCAAFQTGASRQNAGRQKERDDLALVHDGLFSPLRQGSTGP